MATTTKGSIYKAVKERKRNLTYHITPSGVRYVAKAGAGILPEELRGQKHAPTEAEMHEALQELAAIMLSNS
jgi:hypothetical protein